MVEERKLTITRALKRVKTIEKKLPGILEEITLYCSKKKGSPDRIKNQKKHVQSLIQKYNDLLNEWTRIKLGIQKANLETKISYTKDGISVEMSLAEAILWKGVRGARQGRKVFEKDLLNAFNTKTADEEIKFLAEILEKGGVTSEEIAAANLVPELIGWDPVDVKARKDFLMDLEGEIDTLIDEANTVTFIEF